MPVIEIDGHRIEVAPGTTIMEAAGKLGIYIPFFCYHPKLSVAANCRMCLVDVEKAPKPLPACATPVADGMRVFTASPKARMAQQGVLEFLLINHPLDCPICDQGGECPLQDITLGFSNPHSRYTEEKRVVKDKDIGPLIATEMTRCIHCTRCVRFGQEIAGIMELGATGRGETMEIGTYVEKAVRSELSGNIIDLCPVGALTSKPFRYKARNWELKHTPGVCPHCSTGCHIDINSRGREVMRVLPRPFEPVNEEWICDKGRYAYEGLTSPERISQPLRRIDGEWRPVSWQEALEAAADGLQKVLRAHGGGAVGGLASARASTEELYLFQALLRGMDSPHVDHRLTQGDFRLDAAMPLYPALNVALKDLEREPVVLLVGAYPRHEQPLTNHRLRKAALAGSRVYAIAGRRRDFNYPATQIASGEALSEPRLLAQLLRLLDGEGLAPVSGREDLAPVPEAEASLAELAVTLRGADNPLILLGSAVLQDPDGALLVQLAQAAAQACGGRLGWLAEGANSAGAWLAGCVPHRLPGGAPAGQVGFNARAMLEKGLAAYVLLDVEPGLDAWDGNGAREALKKAEFVVYLGAFAGEARDYADVLLPIAAFGENAGTFINNEGRVQSFGAAVRSPGEVRPAWKVLRVVGDRLGVDGCDYDDLVEVREAWKSVGDVPATVDFQGDVLAISLRRQGPAGGLLRLGGWPVYRGDPLVRRSRPLAVQQGGPEARMHPEEAARLELAREGMEVVLSGIGGTVSLPLVLDRGLPLGVVAVPAGYEACGVLGPLQGTVEVVVAPRAIVAEG